MGTPEIRIRLAGADDIGSVRDLLVETWHDTYDALIGPAKVTEITDSWHSIDALRRQLDAPERSFLVAEVGGTIVGHVLANAERRPLLVIARLYVRPSAQRRGIGRALMAAAVSRHPETREVVLEVEAGNAKGLDFYRREGFAVVGERREAGIDHFRMRKLLAPSH